MNKLLILSVMLLARPVFASPALHELKPLGSADALTIQETAQEVFSGAQWAVYEISRQGACTGYALANVDTRVYMRMEVGNSACQADTVIQLAEVKSRGEYRLTLGDSVTDLVKQ